MTVATTSPAPLLIAIAVLAVLVGVVFVVLRRRR